MARGSACFFLLVEALLLCVLALDFVLGAELAPILVASFMVLPLITSGSGRGSQLLFYHL